MKYRLHCLCVAALLAFAGVALLTACSEEEPVEHHFTEYDDSTGLEITDSITVIFDGKMWKTLTYSVRFEQQEMSSYRWAIIEARMPGKRFPAFKLNLFLEPGNHSSFLTINDPGLGYTIPGALTGDAKGGALYYYEKKEISSPDGTRTSDWWPLEITTSVLDYNKEKGILTARVTAKLFDYASWVDRTNMNVADCDTREVSVTFGGLPLLK